MRFSLVILTKNSENSLHDVVMSVPTADEVVVVDDFSTDDTINIAKKLGANVYKRELHNDFAKQRNYALSKTKNEWVLFLDSDEVASKLLVKSIDNLNDIHVDGFFIKRSEVFLDKKLTSGEWGSMQLLRFGNKSRGIWKRAIHEYWDINNTAVLKGEIIHTPNNSLSYLISKINRYSHIHAHENKREHKSASLVDVIAKPIGKFIANYIFRLGFRDGVAGFVYAVLMSFHSFLAWSTILIESQKK